MEQTDWKALAEEDERKEIAARAAWKAKWSNRLASDPRIERVAHALCIAKGEHPLEIRQGLGWEWADVVNPPRGVRWLVGEPYWMEYQQQAWEFLHMQDAMFTDKKG